MKFGHRVVLCFLLGIFFSFACSKTKLLKKPYEKYMPVDAWKVDTDDDGNIEMFILLLDDVSTHQNQDVLIQLDLKKSEIMVIYFRKDDKLIKWMPGEELTEVGYVRVGGKTVLRSMEYEGTTLFRSRQKD